MNEENKINYQPLTDEHTSFRLKWLNDPKVNYFLGIQTRQGVTEESHRKWLERYLEDEKDGVRKLFMVEVDGTMVGTVGLTEINLDDKNAILYIVIGEKDYWGKGIAKEAIEYIHDYAFRELGLHKITLNVHTKNTRAIARYEKSGYKHVGIYREQVLRDGVFEDETLMEIINK